MSVVEIHVDGSKLVYEHAEQGGEFLLDFSRDQYVYYKPSVAKKSAPCVRGCLHDIKPVGEQNQEGVDTQMGHFDSILQYMYMYIVHM